MELNVINTIHMKEKITKNSHLYAFITILLWATVFFCTHTLLKYFSSSEVGFIRYFIASVALFCVVVVRKIKPPSFKDIPLFLVGGATGFTSYVITFNTAAGLMNSGMCSLVITTAPIITAILAGYLFKEKVSIIEWISIGCQFIGIAIMFLWKGEMAINRGVFWMLAAATSLSVYNIVQRVLSKKGYTAIQITTYCIFTGTVFLGFTATEIGDKLQYLGLEEWITAIYLGVFASAVAYFSWSKAISLAKKTSNATNYMFLIPFFATLIGCLVEGEKLTTETLVGGSIIIVGFIIYMFGNEKLLDGCKKENE